MYKELKIRIFRTILTLLTLTWLKVTLLTLLSFEVLVKCSKVIDEKLQQGLYRSDYCKRIGVCAEGTHVMCTHFYPNGTKGPQCESAYDVSINAEYAKIFLGLLNVIRSRSARGKTVGLADLPLPRAYGMFRLQWDPELSTLAQVWANTCTKGSDPCRSTERFPDPGQVCGITRFDKDWIPLEDRAIFNYTGYSLEKVKFGIQSAIRFWYRAKQQVHPEDITDHNYVWPKYLNSNAFLKIVYGKVTHAGCGVSIFLEPHFTIDKEPIDLYYNLKVTLLTLLSFEVLVKCSKVIDEKLQQGLYRSDYCKRIGVCAEGTHVMCTHFYPNGTKGPQCESAYDVSINAEYAKIFLGLLNVIRSRSARGKTVGLADLPLPRAYGMFRLQWDPELSTLAQVWANTCTKGSDPCRSTERFPDPGQVCGITRFDKDWIPLEDRAIFNYTGYSLEKVKFGIQSAIRFWYRAKQQVHPEDITDHNYVWPKYLNSNAFLKIVYGKVTHAGCGVSIFLEPHFTIDKEPIDLYYNTVRIVCNLSSRLLIAPMKDRVYTTDAPSQVGYTVKCGCPIGYDEDEDCLCYESGRQLPFNCKGKDCKPAVVVLPIVTVEKAPPSKLNTEFRIANNHKFMTNEIDPDHLYSTHSRGHDLRGSIFLKQSVFELPPRKLQTTENSEKRVNKLIKNDVSPRRDFSTARKLVSKYLNARRRVVSAEKGTKDSSIIVKNTTSSSVKLHNNLSNVSHINDVKEENFEEPTRRRIVYDNFTTLKNTNIDRILSKGEANNRLISLLNTLEEEAKLFQPAVDRKNVLDHKIRKIYSTFVEKAYTLQKTRNKNEFTDKIENFDDLTENDRLHSYEEQFNTIRKKDLDELLHNNNPILNKQILRKGKNSTKVYEVTDSLKNISLTDKKYHKSLGVRNIHSIRNNPNSKGEQIHDLNNENPLSKQEDDLLPLEKRKLYQDKLDNLEKKLRDFQRNGNRNKMQPEYYMRRVLPT